MGAAGTNPGTIVSSMLTDLVKKEFEPGVRRRGDDYAAAGAVRHLWVDRNGLIAEVHGSEIYDVTVDLEPHARRWDLLAHCTCPAAEGSLCKHVWATLVKAQAKAVASWGPLPTRIRILVDNGECVAAEEGEGVTKAGLKGVSVLVGGGARGRAAAWAHGNDRAPARPKQPKRPAWERAFDSAPPNYYTPERDKPRAPVGPLRYILDAKRSRFSGMLTLALSLRSDDGVRPRRITISSKNVPLLSNDADRAICTMLVGAARPGRESVYWMNGLSRSTEATGLWQLDPDLFPLVLPMLFETGRFCWAPDADAPSGPPRPLRSESEPWDLAFVIEQGTQAEGGGGRARRVPATAHLLRPGLVRGAEAAPLDGFDAVFEGRPGVVLRRDALAPFRSDLRPQCLQWLGRLAPVPVQPSDALPLVRSLHKRGLRIPIRWPQEWPVRERDDVTPRPCLSVRASGPSNAVSPALEATLSFLYGNAAPAEHDGGQYVEVPADGDGAPPWLIRRRPDLEQGAAERLAGLGVKPDPYRPGRSTIAAKKLGVIVGPLIDAGWEVRGENGLFRPAGKIDIRVTTGIDWFGVEGEAHFGGATAPIANVLEALKRNDRFVTLGDGSQGVIPDQWLQRHAGWMQLGVVDAGGLRFSRAQLGIIDAMLAAMPEATCDEQLAEARRKLGAFEGVRRAKAPPAFRGQLRPYQRIGLGWLRFLDEFGFGGCLADDMGLGKTVQVLAYLAERATPAARGQAGPWLLVAPRSVVFNWRREAERFTPSLRVAEFTGPERSGIDGSFAGCDLVLTTFGTLRKDIERLREVEFAGVVLDEAQAIKNAGSQVAKAARLLRTRRRLALTGTPVENSLDDLWSIFEFLNPGMLGSARAFASITKATGGGKDSADLGLIRRALRPFILRRTKKAVAPELPERTEQTIACELAGRQRTLYESLRKHYRDQLLVRIDREGINRSRMHVLEALLRLRQAACHPMLIEPKAKPSPSAKVESLLEMLAEIAAEGNKALVFSQFTSLLDLVQGELDARGLTLERLDGTTTPRERQRCVDRFQSDVACTVFLISLKAGGVGLNLTAAQYVFLLDPWWNPAVEAQAIDRTHRIGQQRCVSAYRLIAKGTVEERILELQATKRELADALVGEQEGGLKALTREDLEWLLS
jgi:superfamily II DNA or RNA helicase